MTNPDSSFGYDRASEMHEPINVVVTTIATTQVKQLLLSEHLEVLKTRPSEKNVSLFTVHRLKPCNFNIRTSESLNEG